MRFGSFAVRCVGIFANRSHRLVRGLADLNSQDQITDESLLFFVVLGGNAQGVFVDLNCLI